MEIANLKSQQEKLCAINEKNSAEMERQLNVLRTQLKNKETKLGKLDKEAYRKEEQLQAKLLSVLNAIKRKFNAEAEKLKAELKVKNDEIYTLKVKLSIREDRLRTDAEQRKEAQEKFIEKLEDTVNQLHESSKDDVLKVNVERELYQEQILSLENKIKKIQRNIEDESVLVHKLDREGERIQQEIEEMEYKYLQQVNELEKLIQLKNSQLAALAKNIIQKEHLFEAESAARREIEQLTRSRLL